LDNCINQEWKNYEYYYYEYENIKLKIDDDILEGEEELNYLSNYNPSRPRDIYYKTFQQIKKKAWIILKNNYIKDLANHPEELFKYIKNNVGFFPPDEIKITYKKLNIQRTKWKSQI
jgi:hypothetical protein